MKTFLLSKINNVVVYIFILYMITMTGLYFHMDSRINTLQTIQSTSLDLFKRYSEKDIRQQSDIDDLNGQIGELKDQLNNMDSKLSNISNLLIGGNKRR